MKKGIRKKITASFFIISILLTGIISAIWYYRTSEKITDIVSNYTFKIMSEENNNFMVTLKDIEYLCTTISINKPNVINVLEYDNEKMDSYDQLINDRKLDDYISSMYAYKYYITGISVVSTGGRNFSEGTCSLISMDDKKKLLSRVMKDSRLKIAAHSLYNIDEMSPQINDNVITVTAPVRDDNGIIGMVTVDCTYDMIKTIFNSMLPGSNDLYVIDNTGKIIYNSESTQLNGNIKSTKYKDILGKIKNDEGSFADKINGQSVFVVYYKSTHTNWITIGIVPRDIMLKETVNTFRTTTVISFVMLILFLVGAAIISYNITKNIEKLRNAMEKVKNGDLKSSIVINSNDEIEDLSNTYNNMIAQINKLLENIKEEEKQKRHLEVKALQAQINPHFLSNTLNTVKWLADVQKIYNISNLTNSIIELLHASIGKKEEFITIKEELEYVEHYINIEQYKYCDKFKINFDIEESIINYKIPRLLLQPVVENAVLHGIEPIDGQGIITVRGLRKDNLIFIFIKDNGIGMTESEIQNALTKNDNKKRFSNIGLKNTDARIKLYYGEEYGINITSVKNLFTEIQITIPYIEEE